MFKLKHLTKTFRTGDIETTALDRIDLDIEAGEYLAITGPSGCGKSTLLGILGLLDAPSSGEYWFDGHNVAGWNERQLNALRRGRIGFVFQSFNLIDDLTVAENIGLALEYGTLAARDRRARVSEVMERLGLTHRASHRPSQLSGGQQQRVAIARAIAAPPTGPAWCAGARARAGPAPAPPPPGRGCGCPTSPPATWTARTAPR